jgi:hypothetical protein
LNLLLNRLFVHAVFLQLCRASSGARLTRYSTGRLSAAGYFCVGHQVRIAALFTQRA